MRMNNIRTKELYSSPNGDRWYLCREGSGRLFIALSQSHYDSLEAGFHLVWVVRVLNLAKAEMNVSHALKIVNERVVYYRTSTRS
jgi:hypothetical protein